MKSLILVSLLGLCHAFSIGPQRLLPPEDDLDDDHLAVLNDVGGSGRPGPLGDGPTMGNFTFTQKLDHSGVEAGTFQQRVWWNAEFWAGPGSPIIFFTPGETAADRYGGYLTNTTFPGRLAQEMQGAVVLVEHRYWGRSSPFAELSTKNLQHLTLNNSIADFVYFAATVKLPFDVDGTGSNASQAPWIYSGGSYVGSLAAWTEKLSPGTFWAYYASSAPVQVISDYWQYFVPVEQGMPNNCSRDLNNVINYIDNTLTRGSLAEQYQLKQRFGLETLQNDDFVRLLMSGPYQWQPITFYGGYSLFFQFCDAIEGVGPYADPVPGDEGDPDLLTSLNGYANWIKQTTVPGVCQLYGYLSRFSLECFDSHNPENLIFKDWKVDNPADRQWVWMLCNEPFGWWQTGAPPGTKSIVSRLVTSKFWTDQCSLYFPPEGVFAHGLARGASASDINDLTLGWNSRPAKRLIYVNGEFDPWRTAGMSSVYRPGGPLEELGGEGRMGAEVRVVPGGYHCSELSMRNAAANEGVENVVREALEVLKGWTREWYVEKGVEAGF